MDFLRQLTHNNSYQTTNPFPPHSSTSPSALTFQPSVPKPSSSVPKKKKLTPSESQDRRDKGLCCTYDDKFVPDISVKVNSIY